MLMVNLLAVYHVHIYIILQYLSHERILQRNVILSVNGIRCALSPPYHASVDHLCLSQAKLCIVGGPVVREGRNFEVGTPTAKAGGSGYTTKTNWTFIINN
jgi:hypothetical protein